MSKKKPRRAKPPRRSATGRQNTPLSGHERQGKLVRPPLMAYANTQLDSWLRDRFPDYLWSCYILARGIDRGTKVITATFDHVNGTLDRVLDNSTKDRPILDGSLTSWEQIPDSARAAVIKELIDARGWEVAVPEDFAHVLGMYPNCPGS